MSQFFVELWSDYGLFKIAAFVVPAALALRMPRIEFNPGSSQCGSRFKKVADQNNLNERITNYFSHTGRMDTALEDTSFFRYTGCNVETKNLDQLALEARFPELKSPGSKLMGFK